jgi:glycosyltransferase involved in cell wall biosynthesis
MGKLIIQIPCLNEEKTLPATIADLPRRIDGVDVIELQVISDGSTDRTVEVARALGVHHVLVFKNNRGLAEAFKAGVDNAVRHGADILVNTDADNQYNGADIAKLVKPILAGEADMVIGCRPIDDHPEFSWIKRKLQKYGSATINRIAGTDIPDTTSGFRAYSRDALLRLNIFSDFSYTLETIIQNGYQNAKIVSVPVLVNPQARESRLYRSIPHYLWQSLRTILKIFIIYRSGPFFTVLSATSFAFFLLIVGRYVYLIADRAVPMSQFWPSIIMAGVLFGLSVQFYLTGILCALISTNRKLSEEVLYRLRKLDLAATSPGDLKGH